jgi:hypothetical protein
MEARSRWTTFNCGPTVQWSMNLSIAQSNGKKLATCFAWQQLVQGSHWSELSLRRTNGETLYTIEIEKKENLISIFFCCATIKNSTTSCNYSFFFMFLSILSLLSFDFVSDKTKFPMLLAANTQFFLCVSLYLWYEKKRKTLPQFEQF